MIKLTAIVLLACFVTEAYAQAIALAVTSTFGSSCVKQPDCPPTQECRMYDFYQYPAMWPPCPHIGYCTCQNNYVQIWNGSCIPYVNLNLYDKCSNQSYEVVQTPIMKCDGAKVICNPALYVDRGGTCALVPVTVVTPAPTIVPASSCQTVSWMAACDSRAACCDTSRGLTCQTQSSTYQQCLCAQRHNVYDQLLGYCRPRIYGDLCFENEDCNSGLISNTGFECRIGRCRCANGFDPVDNLYWNATSLTTYTRRICVTQYANTWVPTGLSCTLNPELVADSNSTSICHPRAFCHLCYADRNALSSGKKVANGTCRELTCNQDSECYYQGACNRWNGFVDPPCDRGMCDCQTTNGFFKDRFSRCSPMRQMWLGDRCTVATNALHPWYVNNENWDQTVVCVPDDDVLGYAGYAVGVVKCKLPLVEDNDGNCVRNDDPTGILINTVGYNQSCNDDDHRLPRTICDQTKNLTCRSNLCQCPQTAPCANSYSGCTVFAATTTPIWDGTTCRIRTYGDPCRVAADCCSGQCIQGFCGCAAGLTVGNIASTTIENGFDTTLAVISTTKYCFSNYTIVGKGKECHLDPVAWNCGTQRYGWNPTNNLQPLLCDSNLVCLRCPADFRPSDESHGICRSITQITTPNGSCGQVALTSQISRNGPSNSTNNNIATSIHFNRVVTLFMLAVAQQSF